MYYTCWHKELTLFHNCLHVQEFKEICVDELAFDISEFSIFLFFLNYVFYTLNYFN